MSESKKSKKKIIMIVGIIILLIVLIGIGVFLLFHDNKKLESTVNKNEDKQYYSEYRMSGNSLEDFDLQFLQLETDNQNMVYSPLSIKYALAMLSEGAKSSSKGQIDALIGDYETKKYVNSSNMSFANAMFIRNTFQNSVNDNYTNQLQDKFNAEIIYDAFENADFVNSWIRDKTFGLVDKLVDNVNDKQFLLVNALAIDMEWNQLIQAASTLNSQNVYWVTYAHEDYRDIIWPIEGENYGTVKFNDRTFDSKAVEIGASINNYDIVNELGEDTIRATITQEYTEWFESSGGCGIDNEDDVDSYVDRFISELNSNYKKVQTSTDFKFYDDDDVKVFSKELKEYNGTTLEYIGIMPKADTLNSFVKNTSAKALNEIIGKIKTVEINNFEEGAVTRITGGIPLFQYEYELDLMSDLQKLGVTDVFSDTKADLSGIVTDSNAIIDEVMHKANIEFSNEGIKAAAVTSVGGLGDSSCGFEHLYEVPLVTIDLTFDNPYLYIIRDKNSGEVWFMGTVYQPIENTDKDAEVINK